MAADILILNKSTNNIGENEYNIYIELIDVLLNCAICSRVEKPGRN